MAQLSRERWPEEYNRHSAEDVLPNTCGKPMDKHVSLTYDDKSLQTNNYEGSFELEKKLLRYHRGC